ncbi:hypothetical protein DFS34DRAFT_325584 [Phlyctochytrium arcticum]|nr:hypothetical protein DFS34DRAFT_325584 [Phlyctochytrium arcticum]
MKTSLTRSRGSTPKISKPTGVWGRARCPEVAPESHCSKATSMNLCGVTPTGISRKGGWGNNFGLNTWAAHCLVRHGGFFATHPVFPFLVADMPLKASNRRVSYLRMRSTAFARLENSIRSMTSERLQKAEEQMKAGKKVDDLDVHILLGELGKAQGKTLANGVIGLYGRMRLPQSRETRIHLSLRATVLIHLLRQCSPTLSVEYHRLSPDSASTCYDQNN